MVRNSDEIKCYFEYISEIGCEADWSFFEKIFSLLTQQIYQCLQFTQFRNFGQEFGFVSYCVSYYYNNCYYQLSIFE